MVKSLPANAEDIRDTGSIPGLGKSPEEGHGNPLQYSDLENPMDGGAWRAAVPVVAQSDVTERLSPAQHMCQTQGLQAIQKRRSGHREQSCATRFKGLP